MCVSCFIFIGVFIQVWMCRVVYRIFFDPKYYICIGAITVQGHSSVCQCPIYNTTTIYRYLFYLVLNGGLFAVFGMLFLCYDPFL